MAIVWQQTIDGTCYEVRSAGQTRRLYTDGVFHSQYHPARNLAGGIWDLLWLPALFNSHDRIRRVLVLGVGGGTVINQLLRHVQPEEIIGVELNHVHLQVARRFFGVSKKVATLVQADAVQWMKNYSGPPFDMIIDDLFGEENGEPVRAVTANSAWCRLLLRHLDPAGMLVMNFIGVGELGESACLAIPGIAQRFRSVYRLSLPGYENAIGVFARPRLSLREINKNISSLPGDIKGKTGYRIRRIK